MNEAALRASIAANLARWQPRLTLADRVRAHPEVPAGLAVLLLVLRPRTAAGLAWLGSLSSLSRPSMRRA